MRKAIREMKNVVYQFSPVELKVSTSTEKKQREARGSRRVGKPNKHEIKQEKKQIQRKWWRGVLSHSLPAVATNIFVCLFPPLSCIFLFFLLSSFVCA